MEKLKYLDLVAQIIYAHTYEDIFVYIDPDELEDIENELEERLKDFKKEI